MCMNFKQLAIVLFLSQFATVVCADTLYSKLYSDFIAACVVSQKKKKNEAEEKKWGHITLYIHNTCVDLSSENPKLKSCSDFHDGTWISVNAMFKNANWIAAEGWNFGLRGVLKDSHERLTAEKFTATTTQLINTGIFNKLIYHDEWVKDKPTETNLTEYMAIKSIDMDFAITFGRNVNCAFLPITENQRILIINYLNRKNEEFVSPKHHHYVWSPYSNNCAHLTSNTLSTLGIFAPKNTNAGYIKQLANLAVPSQVYLDVASVADKSIDLLNPQAIVSDPTYWQLLKEYSWLPLRHGVLTENYPAIQDNDLYNTKDLNVFVLDWNPFRPKFDKFKKISKNKLAETLKTNLETYESLYKKSQEKTSILLETTNTNHDKLVVYSHYLENQLADIQKKKTILEKTDK